MCGTRVMMRCAYSVVCAYGDDTAHTHVWATKQPKSASMPSPTESGSTELSLRANWIAWDGARVSGSWEYCKMSWCMVGTDEYLPPHRVRASGWS